ncbi:MAG: DUF192 domain-containing protein [Candidatus Omnitrophica bacterium]|nr:DUF192 domain-containing protein [Candidatus Omnitrophota bacterium]
MLAEDVSLADTSLKRLTGLLGKKELSSGKALIIRPCNSVHTFFMRFSIDVIFIDKHSQIIKAISDLRPFRLTRPYFHATSVIELPVGVIKSTSSLPGDILKLD